MAQGIGRAEAGSLESAQGRAWRVALTSDVAILCYIALTRFLLHLALNGRYGYHRDELAVIDYARTMAWGYVEFPPFTPFIVRVAMTLFGESTTAVRVFGALAQSLMVLMAGLIARDLGARRPAQILAALAAWVAPFSLLAGSLTLYATYDTLWWVATAWALVRLQKSQNPRWWLAVGAFLGLGAMTKYTIGILIAGVLVGLVATPMRRWLRTPWPWYGAALALAIVLPNLVWQAQHDFIAVEFTGAIHARDVRWGRTDDFLVEQLYVNANPLLFPLWIAGLAWLFAAKRARPYRILAWMYVVPFALFYGLQGRGYYMAATYIWLGAAGAVAWGAWISGMSPRWSRLTSTATWAFVAVAGVFGVVLATPVAPVNSGLWRITAEVHDVFREELLWPELVQETAAIYSALPPEERAVTGIFAGNYGEAGAINVLGPALGLPAAISATNTYWLRGYGDPPPEQVLVLGVGPQDLGFWFTECAWSGRVSNPDGIDNEEASYPGIYLCRGQRQPWAEMWPRLRTFG